jgi:histidinol phosphatase-like enzyme
MEWKKGSFPRSSIKLEKQRELGKINRTNKKGIAKEPFPAVPRQRKAEKRRQESRREKRFSGSLFLLARRVVSAAEKSRKPRARTLLSI